jgi:hypothetical protein
MTTVIMLNVVRLSVVAPTRNCLVQGQGQNLESLPAVQVVGTNDESSCSNNKDLYKHHHGTMANKRAWKCFS